MTKLKISIQQGECVPRFYLPVYRDNCRMRMVCYPVYIAGFVLIYLIARNILSSIWFDLVEFNQMQRRG